MAKVPFPQHDYPGSKISPWTGKPWTQAEKNIIQQKVSKRNRLGSRTTEQSMKFARLRELSQANAKKVRRGGNSPLAKGAQALWDAPGKAVKGTVKRLPNPGFAKQSEIAKRAEKRGSLAEQFKRSDPLNHRERRAKHAENARKNGTAPKKKQPNFNAAVERKRIKYAQSRKA